MALTPQQMDEKMHEHFAFEARDNIEGVLATLTEDVEHDIVGWPFGPSHGRDGARKFYEATFHDLSESKVRCVKRRLRSQFHGRRIDLDRQSARDTVRPRRAQSSPLEFRLLHVVEFSDSGDIKRENVWLDLASIIRQLPQD